MLFLAEVLLELGYKIILYPKKSNIYFALASQESKDATVWKIVAQIVNI